MIVKALQYAEQFTRQRNAAVAVYSRRFEPLTIDSMEVHKTVHGTGFFSHGHGKSQERGMLFMWNYEKRLQYPIKITTPNAKIATFIMSQYGGPDGEIGASMRYLSQRFTMSDRRVCGLLTDIGTEELAHLEMVSTIVHQLTRNLSMEEIEIRIWTILY